ncbi:GTPase activating protein (GAP) for Rho1p [Sporothrix eucalyptigena]|uniref:GTPase activating protein (GAP) for Rho1p n=1 Tax=Sporothrix eucalyptigena TaxID=1812306 RepID=A0ABP0BYP1_9PEZI
MPPPPAQSATSPPTKRDLKSWWKGFKLQSRNHDLPEQVPRGIFGVPLRQSITYANVAISLIDENGKSYIYGYVPIVVAKCGVFLKEKATEVEGIFRLSGSEKRIKELKLAFDSPDRYGKGLSWTGYTVHDAANVLRRYLNDLPEPVVPLDFYERFREPLRHAIKQGSGDADGPQFMDNFDMGAAISQYQGLITELPPLNRQLLLYILDLLAVFAAKADVNRMNSQNLAAIFQPGILSHPTHAMAPEEYRLNQIVLIFLIENQDHFLIGMRGTAADEKTVQEVSRGTPPVTPGVQMEGAGVVGVTRTASNASAGAESVARDGKIRRNRSTSSRNSRHSNHNAGSNPAGAVNNANSSSGLSSSNNNHVGHSSSPRSSSPGIATPTTSGSGGGLSRSNTLPARSPGIGSGRFAKRTDPSASPVSPLTPINPHPSTQAAPVFDPVAEVVTPAEDSNAPDPFTSVMMEGASHVAPVSVPVPGLGFSPATPVSPGASLAPPAAAEPPVTTPSKERRFQLFQRSNTNESGAGELRPQPNKLKKKRLPSSANPSAQSSTASLPSSSAYASPSYEPAVNPLDEQASQLAANDDSWGHRKESVAAGSEGLNESTPRVSQVPSVATTATTTPTPSAATGATAGAAQLAEATLRPQRNSPSTSLHSSFNEGSEIDQVNDSAAAAPQPQETHNELAEKTKKRLWRLSRRRDEMQSPTPAAPAAGTPTAAPPHPSTSNLSSVSTPPGQGSSLGSNAHAGVSTSSVGSGGPSLAGVGSLTGASGSSDPALVHFEASHDAGKGEEHKGKISGWLKNKYRGAKETAEQRRNKSPSPTDQSAASTSTLSGVMRGKSIDLDRVAEENDKPQ